MKRMRYKLVLLLSLLSLPAMLLAATGGPAAAAPQRSAASARTAAVTSSNLGTFKPTFAGPAATGCSVNCSLLTGPVNTPSTAAAARANAANAANAQQSGKQDQAHAMPLPHLRPVNVSAAGRSRLAQTPSFPVPSVSCQRSEEHTSELQSHHPISYAVFCLDRKSVV